MTSLLQDPEFASRFRSRNPEVMHFLNEGPGAPAARVMDDGRSQRAFPMGSQIAASMAEKSRTGDQLRNNAMSGTGSFINKPHMDLLSNTNYHADVQQSANAFGRGSITDFFSGSGPQLPPALKSDWAVILMIGIIGYLVIFRK
jgi:hypothetical protein